jgi:predicted phosphodiesterase
VRVHLAHGDEADLSTGYRLISAALHSRPFHALVDRLGPDRGWRLLARIAGEPHPDRRPSEALLAAQKACAARHLATADLVVFGHTHAPSVTQIGGGHYVNLGDQVRHHTWLWFEDGRFDLRRGTG